MHYIEKSSKGYMERDKDREILSDSDSAESTPGEIQHEDQGTTNTVFLDAALDHLVQQCCSSLTLMILR